MFWIPRLIYDCDSDYDPVEAKKHALWQGVGRWEDPHTITLPPSALAESHLFACLVVQR